MMDDERVLSGSAGGPVRRSAVWPALIAHWARDRGVRATKRHGSVKIINGCERLLSMAALQPFNACIVGDHRAPEGVPCRLCDLSGGRLLPPSLVELSKVLCSTAKPTNGWRLDDQIDTHYLLRQRPI